MRPPLLKSASILTAICYFTTQVALGAVADANLWTARRLNSKSQEQAKSLALPLPLFPSGQIPLPYATLQETHASPNDASTKQPRVILIQDVHMNAEAQTNIARTLEQLTADKKIAVIGVEGAFARFDFEPFRKLPQQDIVRTVAKSYLDNNALAAPSYVGLTSKNDLPPFIGVDDREHYDLNVKAYLDAMALKDKVTEQINNKERELNARKLTTFSSELKKFDALRAAYHKGDLGIGAYIQKIGMQGTFLEAYKLEKSLNFDQADRERKQVLERLTQSLSEQETRALLAQSLGYRTGRVGFGAYYQHLTDLCDKHGVRLERTPAFKTYIRYVLLSDRINARELLVQVDKTEQEIETKLATTPEQKALLAESNQLRLVQKLVAFSLTPEEWKKYRRGTAENLRPFEQFYEQADIRSEKMAENLLATGPGPVVLVTGGFHTPEIAKILRERNISYKVISPKLTKIDSGSGTDYLSVFAREKTPLEKLFQGQKLFLSPVSQNIADQAAYAQQMASNLTRISGSPNVSFEANGRVCDAHVEANPAAAFDIVNLTWRNRISMFMKNWAKRKQPSVKIAGQEFSGKQVIAQRSDGTAVVQIKTNDIADKKQLSVDLARLDDMAFNKQDDQEYIANGRGQSPTYQSNLFYWNRVLTSDSVELYLLVDKNNELRGFFCTRLTDKKGYVELKRLATHPTSSVPQQGRFLFDAVMRHLKRNGARTVGWGSSESAIGFYHRVLYDKADYETTNIKHFILNLTTYGTLTREEIAKQKAHLDIIKAREDHYQSATNRLPAGHYEFSLSFSMDQSASADRVGIDIDESGQWKTRYKTAYYSDLSGPRLKEIITADLSFVASAKLEREDRTPAVSPAPTPLIDKENIREKPHKLIELLTTVKHLLTLGAGLGAVLVSIHYNGVAATLSMTIAAMIIGAQPVSTRRTILQTVPSSEVALLYGPRGPHSERRMFEGLLLKLPDEIRTLADLQSHVIHTAIFEFVKNAIDQSGDYPDITFVMEQKEGQNALRIEVNNKGGVDPSKLTVTKLREIQKFLEDLLEMALGKTPTATEYALAELNLSHADGINETIEKVKAAIVKQSGPGLNSEDAWELFESPFFTTKLENARPLYFGGVRPATTIRGGAGKGLYLSRQRLNIARYGYERSSVGDKTVFSIVISLKPKSPALQLSEPQSKPARAARMVRDIDKISQELREALPPFIWLERAHELLRLKAGGDLVASWALPQYPLGGLMVADWDGYLSAENQLLLYKVGLLARTKIAPEVLAQISLEDTVPVFGGADSITNADIDELFEKNFNSLNIQDKIYAAYAYYLRPGKSNLPPLWRKYFLALLEGLARDGHLTQERIQNAVHALENPNETEARSTLAAILARRMPVNEFKLSVIDLNENGNARHNFADYMKLLLGLLPTVQFKRPQGLPVKRHVSVMEANKLGNRFEVAGEKIDLETMPHKTYGRTWVFETASGKAIHIKFRKHNESISDLVYEYEMMNFLRKKQMSKEPGWDLQGIYPEAHIPLGMTEDGNLFIAYVTPLDEQGRDTYSTYLNDADPELDDKAFLKALRINVHDRAVMARNGLFDSEITELSHATGFNQRLFDWAIDLKNIHIERWGTGDIVDVPRVTRYPNIRYSGPADLTKLEFFHDTLSNDGPNSRTHRLESISRDNPAFFQNLTLATRIGDIIEPHQLMLRTYLERRGKLDYESETTQPGSFYVHATRAIFDEMFTVFTEGKGLPLEGISLRHISRQAAYDKFDTGVVPESLYPGAHISTVRRGRHWEKGNKWDATDSSYLVPSYRPDVRVTQASYDTGPYNGPGADQEFYRAMYIATTRMVATAADPARKIQKRQPKQVGGGTLEMVRRVLFPRMDIETYAKNWAWVENVIVLTLTFFISISATQLGANHLMAFVIGNTIAWGLFWLAHLYEAIIDTGSADRVLASGLLTIAGVSAAFFITPVFSSIAFTAITVTALHMIINFIAAIPEPDTDADTDSNEAKREKDAEERIVRAFSKHMLDPLNSNDFLAQPLDYQAGHINEFIADEFGHLHIDFSISSNSLIKILRRAMDRVNKLIDVPVVVKLGGRSADKIDFKSAYYGPVDVVVNSWPLPANNPETFSYRYSFLQMADGRFRMETYRVTHRDQQASRTENIIATHYFKENELFNFTDSRQIKFVRENGQPVVLVFDLATTEGTFVRLNRPRMSPDQMPKQESSPTRILVPERAQYLAWEFSLSQLAFGTVLPILDGSLAENKTRKAKHLDINARLDTENYFGIHQDGVQYLVDHVEANPQSVANLAKAATIDDSNGVLLITMDDLHGVSFDYEGNFEIRAADRKFTASIDREGEVKIKETLRYGGTSRSHLINPGESAHIVPSRDNPEIRVTENPIAYHKLTWVKPTITITNLPKEPGISLVFRVQDYPALTQAIRSNKAAASAEAESRVTGASVKWLSYALFPKISHWNYTRNWAWVENYAALTPGILFGLVAYYFYADAQYAMRVANTASWIIFLLAHLFDYESDVSEKWPAWPLTVVGIGSNYLPLPTAHLPYPDYQFPALVLVVLPMLHFLLNRILNPQLSKKNRLQLQRFSQLLNGLPTTPYNRIYHSIDGGVRTVVALGQQHPRTREWTEAISIVSPVSLKQLRRNLARKKIMDRGYTDIYLLDTVPPPGFIKTLTPQLKKEVMFLSLSNGQCLVVEGGSNSIGSELTGYLAAVDPNSAHSFHTHPRFDNGWFDLEGRRFSMAERGPLVETMPSSHDVIDSLPSASSIASSYGVLFFEAHPALPTKRNSLKGPSLIDRALQRKMAEGYTVVETVVLRKISKSLKDIENGAFLDFKKELIAIYAQYGIAISVKSWDEIGNQNWDAVRVQAQAEIQEKILGMSIEDVIEKYVSYSPRKLGIEPDRKEYQSAKENHLRSDQQDRMRFKNYMEPFMEPDLIVESRNSLAELGDAILDRWNAQPLSQKLINELRAKIKTPGVTPRDLLAEAFKLLDGTATSLNIGQIYEEHPTVVTGNWERFARELAEGLKTLSAEEVNNLAPLLSYILAMINTDNSAADINMFLSKQPTTFPENSDVYALIDAGASDVKQQIAAAIHHYQAQHRSNTNGRLILSAAGNKTDLDALVRGLNPQLHDAGEIIIDNRKHKDALDLIMSHNTRAERILDLLGRSNHFYINQHTPVEFFNIPSDAVPDNQRAALLRLRASFQIFAIFGVNVSALPLPQTLLPDFDKFRAILVQA